MFLLLSFAPAVALTPHLILIYSSPWIQWMLIEEVSRRGMYRAEGNGSCVLECGRSLVGRGGGLGEGG